MSGQLVLTAHHDLDGVPRVNVNVADPEARIIIEFYDQIARGDGHDYGIELIDDVLTIRGSNRRVVYIVDRDDYDWTTGTYGMRWPD